MPNKYRNKKIELGGHLFDSKLEAKRYTELLEQQERGYIRELRVQPEYELIPPFTIGKKKFRKAVYRADFAYIDNETNEEVVEDAKGFLTEVYKFKRKLFAYRYGKQIIEIKQGSKK